MPRDKLPQSTPILIKRLRRVAQWLDTVRNEDETKAPTTAARANTCWQAAGRLEDLMLRMDDSGFDKRLSGIDVEK